jgi:hypothetical protein
MRINLIDADSIIYICAFDKKDATTIKTLQDCKDLVDSLIFNMLNYTKSTHYLLFLTVGKSFRFQIYPEYKGNRKYADKPVHFDTVKEYLITKYKAIHYPLAEADDLVCIYKESLSNSFISSIDKDILQLEGEAFDYKNFKWVNTTKQEADLFFWKSMVTGDVIDNIKGIAGKGEKFFNINSTVHMNYLRVQIFDEYIEKYGEILGIKEFYKNYMCLKMETKVFEGMVLQEPIEFNKYEEEYKLVE